MSTFHHPRCVFNGGDCICNTIAPEEMERAKQSVAALRKRAVMLIPDRVEGTDLITVEVSGMEHDLILDQENARYAFDKLAHLIGEPCSDTRCCRVAS